MNHELFRTPAAQSPSQPNVSLQNKGSGGNMFGAACDIIQNPSPQQIQSAMNVVKRSRVKYYRIAAGMEHGNIVPIRRGQSGLVVPLLPTNKLNRAGEGVQHDGLENVADQIFGTGRSAG